MLIESTLCLTHVWLRISADSGVALPKSPLCYLNLWSFARPEGLQKDTLSSSARANDRRTAGSGCFGSLHFPSVVLPEIVRSQQLMPDEDSMRGRNTLREHVERERNELLSISLGEIGD
jgi:hypothetical protein